MKNNITEIIIKRTFGETLYNLNDEYKTVCPICKRKAFWFNIRKNTFHCFLCMYKGKLSSVYKEFSPLVSNIGYDHKPSKNYRSVREKIVELPSGYTRLSSEFMFEEGWKYLLSRKINPLSVEVGFTPDKLSLVFPSREDGKIVFWQERYIYDILKSKTNNPISDKTMYVYNIDSLKKGDVCILVEGLFDSLHVNGQATFGSSLSEYQAYKISKKKPIITLMCYDDDAYFNSLVYNKLLKGIPIKLVGGDPSDLGAKEFYQQIDNCLGSAIGSTFLRLHSLSYRTLSILLREKYETSLQYVIS